MAHDLTELINGLEEYRLRSSAMRELQRMGKSAVPALIQALDSPFQSVRWAAIRVLGNIGDPAPIEKLKQLRTDPLLGAAAAEALVAIAQQAPAQMGRVEEEEFVKALVEGTRMTWRRVEKHYVLSIPTTAGRMQEVTLLFQEADEEDARGLIMYSRCGRAHPKHYEWALEQNLRLKLGALAIHKIQGEPCFVMVDRYPRANVPLEVIRKAITDIASKADAVEKALGQRDLY